MATLTDDAINLAGKKSQVSYDDLIGLMDAELDISHGVGAEVSYILDAARINADDTMQEGTDQSWCAIATATIETQLCYSTHADAKAWFKSHGFRW